MSQTSHTNAPDVVLTPKYTRALEYAAALHGTDVRKGTRITYMCHLLGVSALVLEAGGSEDDAIAGLLHDAVEDAGGLPRLADIQVRFGDDVAAIVLACSDSTDAELKKTQDYWERKETYLSHLRDQASDRAALVSIADKIHNIRALVTDLHRFNWPVLRKFNAPDPALILRYYSELLDIAVARNVPETLTIPLSIAIDEVKPYFERMETHRVTLVGDTFDERGGGEVTSIDWGPFVTMIGDSFGDEGSAERLVEPDPFSNAWKQIHGISDTDHPGGQ